MLLVALVGCRRAQPPSLTVSFLTAGDENLEKPSLSPDGTKLVVPSTRGGFWNLWLVDLASGAWTQLTRGEDTDLAPVFVGGGRTVVFHSSRASRAGIWRVDVAHPAAPQFVAEIPRATIRCTAALDDHTLLYGTDHEIMALDLATLARRQLAQFPEAYGFRHIAPSPDRKRLLLGVRRSPAGAVAGTRSDLYVLDLASGGGQWLTNDGLANTDGTFVPDDPNAVVITSTRGGKQNLWLLFLDGRAPVQLTHGAGDDGFPLLLPDGRLLFMQDKTTSRLWAWRGREWKPVGSGDFEQWDPTLDVRGQRLVFTAFDPDTETRLLFSAAGPDFARPKPLGSSVRVLNPLQSRDGHEIVATLELGTQRVLALLDDRGTLLRRYASDWPCNGGSMSADGKQVVFAVKGGGGLFLVAHDGGEPQKIAEGTFCSPRFSPTQPAQLADFHRADSGVGQLELRDLRTGSVRVLGPASVEGSALAWDPSGAAVYQTFDGQRVIKKLSTAAPNPQPVAEVPGDEVTDLAAGPGGLLVAQVWKGRTRLAVIPEFGRYVAAHRMH